MPDPRLEPNQILQGDCREILRTLPSASIDSIVTDPPAGIEFMGKDWDNPDKFDTNFTEHGYSDGQDRIAAPTQRLSNRNPMCRKCRKHMRGAGGCECLEPESDEPPEVIRDLRFRQRDGFVRFMEQVMTECYRVLKPGGHMFVWALPRTSHWTATAIENAGFEIRDCVYHVFGQGFPKSLNVSKAIDKMKGATREVVGTYRVGGNALTPTSEKGGTYGVSVPNSPAGDLPITKPATPEAEQWDGWGTALKPAVECWWLCRKPIEGTNVARNVLQHGTGAINIDGTRIAGTAQVPGSVRAIRRFDDREDEPELAPAPPPNAAGRWPSNLMLSHSEGCRQVGTREVAAPTINRFDDGMKPFGEGAGHPYTQTGGGTEQVSVYECVDGCPVRAMNEQSGETGGGTPRLNSETNRTAISTTAHNPREPNQTDSVASYGDTGGAARYFQTFDKGRWPSNIVLSHTSECVRRGTTEEWDCAKACPIAELDRQGEEMGIHKAGSPQTAQEKWDMSETTPSYGGGFSGPSGMRYGDEGGASRFFQNLEPGVPFFYTAKAARSEKEEGLNPFESTKARQNTHPTVKPISLMRYLVKMVTPPGGIVLDPFTGSGSTLIAAAEEGMKFIGIEREDEYVKIARSRVGVAAERAETRRGERDIFELMMVLGDE